MSFADDLKRFDRKQRELPMALANNVAIAALDSIQNGSSLTGSPGQPVQTGYLRAAWQIVVDAVGRLLITCSAIYAADIEEGTRNGRALTLRSAVGGFHSLAKTAAGIRRIVEDEARKLYANPDYRRVMGAFDKRDRRRERNRRNA